ncbi:YciI family protein [Phenylobacterium sp.]|uniref:YciI family protein n=1 Tax=Phenylobacterium sp. TaxID=1871053 RepID=UPI002FCC6EFD
MPLFALFCADKPDSLPLRMATREAHLTYMAGFRDQLRLAGPMLDDKGDMAGSILFLEAENLAAAQAFSAGDPYRQAGLFDHVHITAFKPTVGTLG